MRIEFKTFYRGSLLFLGCLLCFSLWASAETTNSTKELIPPSKNMIDSASPLHLTFGLDQYPPLKNNQLFGIELWQYAAFLVYVVIAILLAKVIDLLARGYFKRLVKKTDSPYDDLLLDLLAGPVKVLIFVLLLQIGLDFFPWPDWAEKWISKALQLIVAGSLIYLSIKLADLLLSIRRERLDKDVDKSMAQQFFPILKKILRAFVVVIGLLVTMQNMGMNITSLLASLSIGGLALGLGAQDSLGNLFGAVSIFLDKPFQVGDQVRFEQHEGHVENIGLRSTRIRHLDGHLITVPNKTMASTTVINISGRPTIRTVMNIGLTYDTPESRIREAIRIVDEVYRKHPKTHDLLVTFNKFETTSLNLQVIHWWQGNFHPAQLADLQEMNLALKNRFDAAKLEFAFPTQTVYLKEIKPA